MDEYVDSTVKGKVYFYGWLLLVALAVAGLDYYEKTVESSAQLDSFTNDQLIEKIEKDSKTGLVVAAAMQPIFWLSAFMLYRYGKRIRLSGRYPPPGAQIPFRMRVQKGKKARFQAWACYASSVVMVLVGLMYVYLGWYSMQVVERVLKSV